MLERDEEEAEQGRRKAAEDRKQLRRIAAKTTMLCMVSRLQARRYTRAGLAV